MKMVLCSTTALLSLILGASLFVHAARDLRSMVDDARESDVAVSYWESSLHGASMPASIRALLSPLNSHQTTDFLTSINGTPGYLPAHASSFCKAAHIQCGGFFFDGQLRSSTNDASDRTMFPLIVYTKNNKVPQEDHTLVLREDHTMFPLIVYTKKSELSSQEFPLIVYAKNSEVPQEDHTMFPLIVYTKKSEQPQEFPLIVYAKNSEVPQEFPLIVYTKKSELPEEFPLIVYAQNSEVSGEEHTMFPLIVYTKKSELSPQEFPLIVYAKNSEVPREDPTMFPLIVYTKKSELPQEFPLIVYAKKSEVLQEERTKFPLIVYAKRSELPEEDHTMFPLITYAKNPDIPQEPKSLTTDDAKATRLLRSDNVQDIRGFFFREKQVLVSGVKIHVNLAAPPRNGGRLDERAFLPRELAKLFPLATGGPKLSSLLEVSNDYVQNTIDACNVNKDMKEEESACLSSVEDLADFVSSVMGSTKQVNAYDFVWNASNANSIEKSFIVRDVKKLKLDVDEPSLTCHDMPFPSRLFYCHYVKKTMVFAVTLEGEDGSTQQRIAMCHYNTSFWNPQHVSFAELNIKPGEAEMCHFSGKTWMENSGWVFVHA